MPASLSSGTPAFGRKQASLQLHLHIFDALAAPRVEDVQRAVADLNPASPTNRKRWYSIEYHRFSVSVYLHLKGFDSLAHILYSLAISRLDTCHSLRE